MPTADFFARLHRYDGYFALSSNYVEQGGDVVVGIPRATVEASVGRPDDVGTAARRPGVDTLLRVQSNVGPLILGASHLDSNPYLPEQFAKGRMSFTGVDVRWMRTGYSCAGNG